MDMDDRDCPVCGARESTVVAGENLDFGRLGDLAFASRKIPEYMHYRLLRCRGCDLLFASPAPCAVDLRQAYENAAFDSAIEARHAAATYARVVRRLSPALPSRNGALDIGTGDGAFLEQLIMMGFTGVVGVEPSKAPVQSARADVRPLIRLGAFDPAAFGDTRFALVTCFQTIEHVSDPLQLARSAHRLLRPNGALVLVCHNHRAASARLLGRKSPIFDIEHLQLFSRRSLRTLYQNSGFEHASVRSLFNTYPFHYWAKLLPLPTGLKQRILSALKASAAGRLPVTLPAGNLVGVGFKGT